LYRAYLIDFEASKSSPTDKFFNFHGNCMNRLGEDSNDREIALMKSLVSDPQIIELEAKLASMGLIEEAIQAETADVEIVSMIVQN
jgi:hypothetical protein